MQTTVPLGVGIECLCSMRGSLEVTSKLLSGFKGSASVILHWVLVLGIIVKLLQVKIFSGGILIISIVGN